MPAWEGPPAPYRIETERLVIRCYEPRDAPLLKAAQLYREEAVS